MTVVQNASQRTPDTKLGRFVCSQTGTRDACKAAAGYASKAMQMLQMTDDNELMESQGWQHPQLIRLSGGAGSKKQQTDQAWGRK